MEIIAAAAVRHEGVVYSLPPPARHHNVLWFMVDKGFMQDEQTEEGFITDTGRFVSREEAVVIARAAGQLIRKTHPERLLFSEDVW